MLPLCAIALLAIACAAEPPTCDELGTASDSLIHGQAEPSRVSLSAAQVAALVPITGDAGAGELCTGTLVAPTWVLTAQHCLAMKEPSVAGRAVLEAHAHPEHDVALLRLAAPPTDASPLQVQVGALSEEWLGREVTLAGYGVTEDGSVGRLTFLVEPIVKLDASAIRVDGFGRSGACLGDSGGPLLIADGDGEGRVAGVLSKGSASCLHQDGYVATSAVAGWIRKTTGDGTLTETCR